ncbi:MAG: pyrimidine/purine nucleoside phosphorylase [Candidatus Cloacimonetes bacterium]|nr:pyrimidine/purine nucleoside phosphorylase [Candidatus Cloacimonadota bacterium]
MLKLNQYFEGKVASISFENNEGKATVGVMEIGDYEFGTSTVEYMTVISGTMKVQLPGQPFKDYSKGETFIVPANEKFKLIVPVQSAYLCFYK